MRTPVALSLLLALTMLPAEAQPLETVTVEASALVGVWKIAWPQWGRITLGGTYWGPMEDRYCRIEPTKGDLAIRCFGDGAGASNFEPGTAGLEGTQIHFAWGNMLLRKVFDGTLQSPTQATGKMGVKLSGIEHENPELSNAVKFSLSEAATDPGGKAALLRIALEQLAQGPLTLPHDNAAIGKSRGALPGDIHTLGAVQAIAYLGQSSREVPSVTRGVPNVDLHFFNVYAVEFERGERICGLHQRGDGIIDGFLCV